MINFIGFSLVFAFVLILGIIIAGIWIWSIIDCLKSDMKTSDKLIWIIVIIVLNIIGSLIYFLLKDKPQKKTIKTKRLRRSDNDRIIAGVCGGIGEYFDVDPTIIRLLWVVLTIFSIGTGILLYFITALIMPSDNKKVKKSNGTIVVVSVSVAVVLVVLILSVALIAVISINKYGDVSSVSKRIIDVKERRDSTSIAENIARDHIMMNPNYKENQGHNIFCFATENSDECKGHERDPYGITLNDIGCVKVKCKFDSAKPDVRGLLAEVLISKNRVVQISFEKVPKPIGNISSLPTPKSVKDCHEFGYEVLYPELVGGPLQCNTPDGLVNVTS